MDIFEFPYQRLQYARHKSGFTKATDAARHYGFNENTYRSHENGVRGFRPDVAKEYAEKFGVRVEWLLYGTGTMTEGGSIVSEGIQGKFEAAPEYIQKTIKDLLGMK